MPSKQELVIKAAENMNWQQVILSGGPPCFHYEKDRKLFCGRAERWEGHSRSDFHKFISLADLLKSFTK